MNLNGSIYNYNSESRACLIESQNDDTKVYT